MDYTTRPLTGEQWRRAYALARSLSSLSAADAIRQLEGCEEDPEVRDQVRQMLDGAETAHLWRTGTPVGRYTVGEPLGRGAFGEVYRGHDTVLGRPVALKFLVRAARSGKGLLAEAQAASALNHPNIITVFEILETPTGPVMVMEFVEGRSLRELLEKPVSAELGQRYGVQLLEALSAAHAANIVHGDLKPANIMVRPDGYLKVLDFGLARQTTGDSADSRSAAGGTLRYFSPEQCRGQSPRAVSDMFAAGLMLYEMSAGRHPFAAASPVETAALILRAEPKPAGDGPLMRVAMKLLVKDPAQRLTAGQALAELGSSKSVGRRRSKPALAAAVAALACAGAIWTFRTKAPEPGMLFQFRPVHTSAGLQVTAAAISPSGSGFAFAVPDGSITLLDFDQNRESAIVRIPGERVDRITWIGREPKLLVSSRKEAADAAGGIMRIVDTGTRQMRELPWAGRDGLASPDGSRVAYATTDGRALEVASLREPRLVRRLQIDDPTGIKSFAWSPAGNLIHYWTVPDGRRAGWQWKSSVMHSVEVDSGKPAAEQNMPPLLRTAMLADGTLLFTSGGKLAEVRTDPVTGRLLAEPHLLAGVGLMESNLTSSLDGRAIGLVIQASYLPSLHVGELDPASRRLRNPRGLSAGNFTEDYPHAWTPDNEAVLFESKRRDRQPLFRQRVGDKNPEMMTRLPGQQAMAFVSPDGRWIVFQAQDGRDLPNFWKLLRMPLGGGPPEEIPGGPVQEANCQFRAVRCVIREYSQGQMIFHEMDPIKGKGRELLRIPSAAPDFGDWALSPDGRKVSLVDATRIPAAIRVLDLDHPGHEDRIELEGPPPSGGLATWSADGKGWFLAQEPDRMMYFDSSGRGRFVHDVGFWAVPSWDGKRLAYIDGTRESQIHLLQR